MKLKTPEYCHYCKKFTETKKKQSLSASENKHYRYECKNCGFKKEPYEKIINTYKIKKQQKRMTKIRKLRTKQ